MAIQHRVASDNKETTRNHKENNKGNNKGNNNGNNNRTTKVSLFETIAQRAHDVPHLHLRPPLLRQVLHVAVGGLGGGKVLGCDVFLKFLFGTNG